MQQQSKHTFVKSKMNKDLDARLLEAGEYRDGVNVSVSRSESDDVGALENILGNDFLNNLGIIAGTDPVSPVEVIGWHRDENTDSIYLFITSYQDNSSDGLSNYAGYSTTHRIVYFDTKSNNSQTLVEGNFLNFSINSPILHTNLIENLLFWTDNRNQPRKINVETAKANPTYYFNEDHISVAKYYPWNSIKVLEEFSTKAIRVNKFDTADPAAWPNGYNAWRDIFVLNSNTTSEETLDFLENNIGGKGYAIDNNGDRWEFTIAWFQRDYTDNAASTGQILPNYGAGYLGSGKPLVFIEREPTNFTTSVATVNLDQFDIFFAGTTQKNVSSQYLEESKAKLTVKGFGDLVAGYANNTILYNPSPAPANNEYCAPIYKYATRSNQFGLSVPENGNSAIATECPTFTYEQNPLSITKYGVIKHPNIPSNINYYVAFNAVNPVNRLGLGSNWFEIVDEDGAAVNASTIGLNAEDVITIYWPNPDFNPNFAGDERFLEDKFVRFSYRLLFDDGEYSIVAPFTQPVFIPKQKGYFEKRVGSVKPFPNNNNYFLDQEQLAGENTIVDFFVNDVSSINLRIPFEIPVDQLQSKLKVKEIDILYKESTELALKVVKTLDVNDSQIVTNKTNFLPYIYQSEKPIKVLNDQEISRVYDNVPIRAAAQESSGNRIIYGNFYDRHTSPLTLDYLVGACPKLTMQNVQTSNSNISYPNHTLKQNRTYQAGIILADRYGRSSDVALSSFVGDSHTVDLGSDLSCKFGGSTIYHPYFSSVTDPLTPSGTFNTIPHYSAGIYSWPGDSLKVLFSNTIPSTIANANGYPGLYDEWVTDLTVLNYLGVTGDVVGLEIDPTVGVLSEIAPGMIVTWTNADGQVFTNTIVGVNFNGAPFNEAITIENKIPWDDATTAPVAGDTLRISNRETLGWYSYKVVVKQQEQDYYNVYLASLLNGNPVVKPFKLSLAAAAVGDTLITVDATMGEPRTFLLLEGMNFFVSGVNNLTHTIVNILNDDQFEITPPLTDAIGAGYTPEFTTQSTKNLLNVSTLLTDNANKVPPALVETTPVQQQYSTSETQLIPRVAVEPIYNPIVATTTPYVSLLPGINGPIFPGKESAKVNSLGNFESMFVDGSYAGLWQADTDPPAMIVQNKWQLGVFSEDVKPDSSKKASDQLAFTCYETTPVKSELEIFYESSTAGLVSELNEDIKNGVSIPVKLVDYLSVNKSLLGTVTWNEGVATTGVLPIIGQFQLLDGQDQPLLYDPALSGTIQEIIYVNEVYADGTYSGVESTSPPPFDKFDTYEIVESIIPAEIALGVYNIKLKTFAGGNYHREDPNFNNIQIDIGVRVKVFGGVSSYEITYPFQIQTEILNSAPYAATDPLFIANSPLGAAGQVMLALDTPATTYFITNNSGISETANNVTGQFPNIYGTQTKTFNGAYPDTFNKSTPPVFAGNNELVYEVVAEGVLGSGVYDSLDALSYEGLNLVSFSSSDLSTYWVLNIDDVKRFGNPVLSEIGIGIQATDKNGTGLTTIVSKFKLQINY